MRALTINTARFAVSFLRTSRYLMDLLVWSRVFVVRRTSAQLEINDRLLAEKKIAWRQPELNVMGGGWHLAHGFNIVYDVLFANLQKPNHLVARRHALPGPAFAGVYLWDSAFIALIWQHWDRAVAQDVLASVVDLREQQRLQHVAANFTRSDYTQPPLIAWAYQRLIKQAPPATSSERENLQATFTVLHDYNQWLNTHRRLQNGLYFWIHPYESGVENAPRFSSTDEKKLADTRSLAAPDLCAYMVLQCEALQALATLLENDAAARHYGDEVARIKSRVNELLWDETQQMYFDYDVKNQCFIRSRTIASLLPLSAGIPDPARASRLRNLICCASSFGSLIPLPSVALDDKDFEKDMWRGPVWVNTAYLILDGLKRYGFEREYGELAWRLCDGVYRVLEQEHQLYEFYDPECYHTRELNRKKGNFWKALTLGTGPQKDFVGWTGLVNTLMVECLCGYSKHPGGHELKPRFPAAAQGLRFELNLPQEHIRALIEVKTDGAYHVELVDERGQAQDSAKIYRKDLQFGESLTVTQAPPCYH